MRAAIVGVGATLLLCACAGRVREPAQHAPVSSALPSPERMTISVLAVNDMHGRVEQTPLLGGYVQNVRAARARDHGATLLFDAGDIFQGTLDADDLSSCDPDAEIFELARALPAHAVDLIIGGHTHAAIAHRVAGIPVIESRANGQAFGRVDMLVERSSGRLLEARIFEPHALCRGAAGRAGMHQGELRRRACAARRARERGDRRLHGRCAQARPRAARRAPMASLLPPMRGSRW